MSDSEWRTPYHEECEREWNRMEAAARRGQWPMPDLGSALDAVKADMVKAVTPMTPAEREAEALLSLAIRREMADRERREATYFPEVGDVVTRLDGDAERHERSEDVERVQGEAE